MENTENMTYSNLMEELVLNQVDRVMTSVGGCTCPICRSDVIAYALNHLPHHYVSSNRGRLMVQVSNYERQFSADVIAALGEAAELVSQHPRHEA